MSIADYCRDPIGCSHDGYCTCQQTAAPAPSNPVTRARILTEGTELYDYEVKSWPWFFEPMVQGKKKHDMRDKRDRGYKIGDRMLLREFDPRGTGYTGRKAVARITYVTDNETPGAMSSGALDRNFCILSVEVTPA